MKCKSFGVHLFLALIWGVFLLMPKEAVADSEDDIRDDERRHDEQMEDIRHDEQQSEIRRDDVRHHDRQQEEIQRDYNERRILQEEVDKQEQRLHPESA
jgi:hypothetical protein